MASKLGVAFLIWCSLAASALAGPPPLEPHASGALSVALPKGWKVTISAGGATTFVAQQDPAKADAAAILVTVQPTGNTSTEDQLLDIVAKQVAQDVKVGKREAVAGGGRALVADGMAGENKVRIAVIAIVSGQSATTCVLVSKVGDFDGLGGLALVKQVVASVKSTPPK
jgi:hypothetical protein